jgi:long-chain fatty acid transport protein
MTRLKVLVLLACVGLMPGSAWAQGHMNEGVGPVNSAMGGAGTALPNESIGALTFNPALIAEVKGNQLSFTSEFYQDSIQIDTTIGGQTGHAESRQQVRVVPAFGWMLRDPAKKMALGFGLIGVGGFRTDYPQSNASLLFAQPPNGFDRIFTDYSVTKIPLALAYQVTPKLSVGVSGNLYVAEFAVSPLPYKYFDVDTAGNRWYEGAGSLTTRFAFAAQFGMLYKHSDKINFGAAVTTPQNYSSYSWNSTNANPSSRQYGQSTTVEFDLDGPMVVSFGTGLKPSNKTQIAIDGMFTKYEGIAGFGGPGGVIPAPSTPGVSGGSSPGGVIDPFGWRDIWTFKVGLQHQVTDKMVVRAGYNFSQMPVKSENVLTATGAPLTFQNRYSAGFGMRMFPFLEAEFSAYIAPRTHLEGPLVTLTNQTVGSVDESNSRTGLLIGLNFTF